MRLMEIDTKIKAVSKARPKSLILRIPSNLRDAMEFKDGTPVKLELLVENNERYIKISEV